MKKVVLLTYKNDLHNRIIGIINFNLFRKLNEKVNLNEIGEIIGLDEIMETRLEYDTFGGFCYYVIMVRGRYGSQAYISSCELGQKIWNLQHV